MRELKKLKKLKKERKGQHPEEGVIPWSAIHRDHTQRGSAAVIITTYETHNGN